MNLKEFREKLKWLDPFTYVDLYLMPKVNPKKSEFKSWIVYLVSAFFFAWLIYTGMGLALGTASPMMIVVSGSMQPLYHRGDIVLLQGTNAQGLLGPEVFLDEPSLKGKGLAEIATLNYVPGSNSRVIESIEFNQGEKIPIGKNGSVVVYWSSYMQEPIIHRVAAKLKAGDGWYLVTKGDSEQNKSLDQDCGTVTNNRPGKPCVQLYPIPIEEVQGKALFHIPVVGCVKLWFLDDLGSLIRTGSLPKEFKQGNIC